MALTHHTLVRLAAHRSGFTKEFLLYAILGDDVVIADAVVALAYKDLMTSIGLQISIRKSVISNETHISTEFASRWLLNGLDYSPLPLGL